MSKKIGKKIFCNLPIRMVLMISPFSICYLIVALQCYLLQFRNSSIYEIGKK